MEVPGKVLEWFYCLLLREAQGNEHISVTELHRQVSLKKASAINPLISAGLVEIFRWKRWKCATVTDAGWRWAHDHLAEVAEHVATKRSANRSDREMLAFLFRIMEKLVRHGEALASLLALAVPPPGEESLSELQLLAELEGLAKTRKIDRLPLALIKREMAPLPPERVDALLLALLSQRRVALEANYDLATLTEEDRRAALRLGTSDKHFVALIS